MMRIRFQVSRFRFRVSSFRFHTPDTLEGTGGTSGPGVSRIAGLLILLTLPALACGFINPQYQMNNEVRLAVYEYEGETRGPVDDLIIDFRRDEPRIKFEGQNENGGRTVWLYRLGVKEFFDLRPPEATYLYIQMIEYNDDRSVATVKVFRGDGASYEERQLTLRRDNDRHWAVTDE